MRRLIVLSLSALFAQSALAHGEAGAPHWWTLDPWVWIPMAAACLLYARGIALLRSQGSHSRACRPYAIAAFVAGMLALFFALIWPLDALSSASFAAHMAQHMLLIAGAAPLIVSSEAGTPIWRALPSSWRHANASFRGLHKTMQTMLRPRIAFAVHGFIIWIWHAPAPFRWALRWEWVHVLEHATFFASAMLFWKGLQQCGRRDHAGYGLSALLALGTLMHTGLLGALITFAPRVLYSAYAGNHHTLLPALEDQQLAGLLMWIPAGLCYLIAGIVYAAAWLRSTEFERSAILKGNDTNRPV